MQKIGVNEYKCVTGELIEIKFFCNPSRENVDIRRSFDGHNFVRVPTNSIQIVMGTETIVLSVQYAFILKGTCLNLIRVVDNVPNNEDRVTARANGGRTDLKTFRFTL